MKIKEYGRAMKIKDNIKANNSPLQYVVFLFTLMPCSDESLGGVSSLSTPGGAPASSKR
jgi:hypothetical protein